MMYSLLENVKETAIVSMMEKKWADVVSIINGKNQKQVINPDGKYPIYGSGGIIGYADEYLCEAGTTIIGRKGTINSPIFVSERFWNVDTAFGVHPKEDVLPKYLYYFCQFFSFTTLDKSTTIPSLAKRDLLNIVMPVFSLEEQERIVARIEELFSELDKAEETLQTTKKQLEVYRQAVLKEAFEGQETWEQCFFSDLMSCVRNGYGQKPDDNGDFPILKISAIRPMKLDLAECRYNKTPFDKENLISENDLIFTRYNGSREYVGVCAYVPSLLGEYAYPDKLIKCTPKISNPFHSKYLQYYMSQGDARKYIRGKIKTTSGQNGISGSDLKKTIVFLPDIETQERIVTLIEAKLSVCEDIEKHVEMSLHQSQVMRRSILKEAFEGRL